MYNEEDIPIDIEAGKIQVGDSEMFITMMGNFESMTLDKNLLGLKMGFDSKNWKNVKEEAHSLKGASAYLCATKLTKLAEDMQFAVQNQEIEKLRSLYPELIKESIKVKLFIKKYFAEQSSILKRKII